MGLTTLPRPPSRLGGVHPFPNSHPPQCLNSRASGAQLLWLSNVKSMNVCWLKHSLREYIDYPANLLGLLRRMFNANNVLKTLNPHLDVVGESRELHGLIVLILLV